MATATKTRLKAKAQIYVPQSKDEAASDIRKIGDLQRGITRLTSEMNDAIANITEAYQPTLQELNDRLKTMQSAVQAYCEAHRDELTGRLISDRAAHCGFDSRGSVLDVQRHRLCGR